MNFTSVTIGNYHFINDLKLGLINILLNQIHFNIADIFFASQKFSSMQIFQGLIQLYSIWLAAEHSNLILDRTIVYLKTIDSKSKLALYFSNPT